MTNAAQLAAYGSQGTSLGFKNRIINGAMMIDQRNAGASVTVNSTTTFYCVDRFYGQGQATDGVFTLQQLSATPPTGYVNYVRATVTTADASIGSTQYYDLVQNIEGLNVADLGWGAAGAATVTLSFWVRSSVTGIFGGALRNSAVDRSYPFSYMISSANTWEHKSITIAGDTTGTWVKNSDNGLRVNWSLGEGSSRLGTAGAWAAANYAGATGQTNLIATLNATWDITGVQLEKGSTATSFDYRPYGTELALCQRYCISLAGTNVVAGPWGGLYTTTAGRVWYKHPVTMRATPTLSNATGSGTGSIIGTTASANSTLANYNNTVDISSWDLTSLSTSGFAGQPLSYNGPGILSAEL